MADPVSNTSASVAPASVVTDDAGEDSGFYTVPSKTKTPASTSTQQSKFGLDLGTQLAFVFQKDYEMAVLDLSARLSYSHRFSDRFTLRTSAGAGVIVGGAQHDYEEDLDARAPDEMEENVTYDFSREHVTRQDIGGGLFGVFSPEVEVSAQYLVTGDTRWTPHVTLGLNQVKLTDTVTSVTAAYTPDSDRENDTPYDYTYTYNEATPVVQQAIGVTVDVVPTALKVGNFEVGIGATFLINSDLDGVRVAPMIEANWQPNFLKKKQN